VDFLSRFKGAILGTAVGDALGRCFEGSALTDPERIKEIAFTQPELRFTDDTQMTMGVASSLIECGGFNGEHMARIFAKNYEPFRGYGWSTSRILQRIKQGEPWDLPAKEAFGGEGSYGNGSAMRAAPIGLLYHQDLAEVRKIAEASSAITHTHPLGTEGAVLQALAVALAVQVESEEFSTDDFLEKLSELVKEEIYLQKLGKLEELLDRKAPPSEVVRELGNGIEAFNSVPTAIYSFLVSPKSFKGAVLGAVGLGGDADTIGAMTGAIAGALNGVDALPSNWLEKLEKRRDLEGLANDLFLLFVKKVLKDHCEVCMTEENVGVYKLDTEAGDDLSNFILLCPKCKRESEEEREELLAKPRKRGKYRAVYRKVYKRK
jgi:poly(ADP-ribose) glycohydrolase ARH3